MFTKENFRMDRFTGMELPTFQLQFTIEESFSLVKGMVLENTSTLMASTIEGTGKTIIRMGLEFGQRKKENGIRVNGSTIDERDQEFIKRMVITL